MSYKVKFTKQALKDIETLKKSGHQALLKKLKVLLDEMVIDPKNGTGKPEMLKYNYAGYWSRRINKAHRIVYSIDDEILIVDIVSVLGHYK